MKGIKKTLAKGGVAVLLLALFLQPIVISAQGFLPLPVLPDFEPAIKAVPTADSAVRSKEVAITILGITAPKGLSLDSITYMAAGVLLEKMTDQIVKWINSGFQDGPFGGSGFALDLEYALLKTADSVAGNIIEGIGAGALCSPFKNKLQNAIRASYNLNRSNYDPANPQVGSCTLSEVTSNIESFIEGNFVDGGWNAWFVMTQDPYGNPYSASLNIESKLAAQIASAVGVQQEELSWSKGFFSKRECEVPGDKDGECAKWGPTKTPGTVIESQIQKTLGIETERLNLADEFDEIVGALIGQLVSVIFTGDGLFDTTNTNYNRNTVIGANNPGNFGSCYPDKREAVIGDEVKWTFSGINLGPTDSISWSGDEGLSGNSTSVTITYSEADRKNAQAVVTRVTVVDPEDPSQNITNTQTITCSDSVYVARFAPLRLECTIQTSNRTVRSVNEPVTWIVKIFGGSGQLSFMDIDEGASFKAASTLEGDNPFRNDFWRLGVSIPGFEAYASNGDSRFWFKSLTSTVPLITPARGSDGAITFPLTFRYPSNGSFSLKFSHIVDMDGTIEALRDASCKDRIEVILD